ncbi:hypothetical protein PGO_004190 [Plasmodium gonderi]|uniref:Variable surface protein n=1 Tax=Plasmodium gonderi TaxID=77519 RepID=A0A1Y1JT81_PLAGO|nr:hypothetical protein PGO_004190 [Plasmodium gonderi]GAW84648.1 hypothetical protein PGO_004190 [Plasmodium gonderi]
MGNIKISFYEGSSALDQSKCMDKYVGIITYIKEEIKKKGYGNSVYCEELNIYINQGIDELKGCVLGGFLFHNLNDSHEIKSLKEICNKHSESTSNPSSHKKGTTQLKREEEDSLEQSKDGKQENQLPKAGGVLKQKNYEPPKKTRISEGHTSVEHGENHVGVEESKLKIVLPQEQQDTELDANTKGETREEKSAEVIQHRDRAEFGDKWTQTTRASDSQETDELDTGKNKPPSQCNFEEKSDEARTSKANVCERGSLNCGPKVHNYIVLGANPFQAHGDKTDREENGYNKLLSTELCTDATDSDKIGSSEYAALEASNSAMPHRDEHRNQETDSPQVVHHQPKTHKLEGNGHKNIKDQCSVPYSEVNSDQEKGRVTGTVPKDIPIVITAPNESNGGNEGIPYNIYILIILVPLAIILLIMFLIKVGQYFLCYKYYNYLLNA